MFSVTTLGYVTIRDLAIWGGQSCRFSLSAAAGQADQGSGQCVRGTSPDKIGFRENCIVGVARAPRIVCRPIYRDPSVGKQSSLFPAIHMNLCSMSTQTNWIAHVYQLIMVFDENPNPKIWAHGLYVSDTKLSYLLNLDHGLGGPCGSVRRRGRPG